MPSPLGYRMRDAMEKFGWSSVRVSLLRVVPWFLPEVTFFRFFEVQKDSVAPQAVSQSF